jgi:hypothetical protein
VKPRKILRESMRVALASFGQLLLEEGAVWAARKVERRRAAGGGRRRKILTNPAIVPLIKEGARYLEQRWSEFLAAPSTSRRRPGGRRRHAAEEDRDDASRDGEARAARKARKKK